MPQHHRSFRLTSQPDLPPSAGTPEAPTLISSNATFAHKRIFPTIFFGFIAFFLCATLTIGIAEKKPAIEFVPFIVVPMFMAAFGYLLMKCLLFDLVDEVWDAGDFLIVKNKGQEIQIELSNVVNLNYSGFQNPPRVTLQLRQPSEFGSEIAFEPPFRWFHMSAPPIANELIQRIDATRRQPSDVD